MQPVEVYYYYQEIVNAPQQLSCPVGGFTPTWEVSVIADGVELSHQEVAFPTDGFRFAVNGGAAVTVSVTPSWRDDSPEVREFTASEIGSPLEGTIFGDLSIEKKHVLAE